MCVLSRKNDESDELWYESLLLRRVLYTIDSKCAVTMQPLQGKWMIGLFDFRAIYRPMKCLNFVTFISQTNMATLSPKKKKARTILSFFSLINQMQQSNRNKMTIQV